MTGTDHHIAGLGNLIEWTNISGQNGMLNLVDLTIVLNTEGVSRTERWKNGYCAAEGYAWVSFRVVLSVADVHGTCCGECGIRM